MAYRSISISITNAARPAICTAQPSTGTSVPRYLAHPPPWREATTTVRASGRKAKPAFLERVKASPDVLECHHITGAWNYLLKVRVGTTRDLERFLSETVKAVDGVERTETLITLSSTKETWKVSSRTR